MCGSLRGDAAAERALGHQGLVALRAVRHGVFAGLCIQVAVAVVIGTETPVRLIRHDLIIKV